MTWTAPEVTRTEEPLTGDERPMPLGYARHNGHADLLREAVDGATGE